MHLMIVCGHMPVRRIITAKRDTTGLAGTQVQPPAMDFDALLTDVLFSGPDLRDRAKVLAYMAVLTHVLKLRYSRDLFIRYFADRRRPGQFASAVEIEGMIFWEFP